MREASRLAAKQKWIYLLDQGDNSVCVFNNLPENIDIRREIKRPKEDIKHF